MLKEEDKKTIEEMDEMSSYFLIDAIGGILWRVNHDASHGRVEITPQMTEEMEYLREQQFHCLNQLGKFGVDPESANDRENGDYWKWFRHWDTWKKELTDEQWDEFNHKMSQKEDCSALLPTKKWNE